MRRYTDLAWAAGFIEGEGCFHFSKRNQLTLRVSQSEPEPLQKLSAIAGQGNVKGPYSYKSNKLAKKPRWVWSISGWAVEDFFDLIEPYMSEGSKKLQAQEAIEKLNQHRSTDTIVV